MKAAACHPDRKHHAKGLCDNCYTKQANERRKEGIYLRSKNPSRASICHPDREYYAKDKCYSCYQIMLYRNNHPKKKKFRSRRERDLKFKYNLSLEEYEELLEKQNNVCYICKLPPNSQGLVVDHDHATGRVRGLLCSSCNTGLGYFRDNIAYLEEAIKYLKQ